MKTQFILVVSLVVLMIGGFPFSVMSQSAAKVENINFYAEGTNLIVTYDIVKAKPGETFNVWIKIVTASGKEITPGTLIGNFGSGNSGGTGKKIKRRGGETLSLAVLPRFTDVNYFGDGGAR